MTTKRDAKLNKTNNELFLFHSNGNPQHIKAILINRGRT